ncbi:hypothetical protein EDB19DRAFT_1780896, partial [Suillus lakei]
VTTNSVYLYHVSGEGSRGSSVLLDAIGCGLGCAVMDWRAEKIVLARDEAVYAYGLQTLDNLRLGRLRLRSNQLGSLKQMIPDW